MTPGPVLVDTNVVVSGLLNTDRSSPPARILDGMLAGRFRFLLSADMLGEYREVLLRPRIQRRHGLSAEEIDVLLTDLAANGIWFDFASGPARTGDDHLGEILSHERSAFLVTGDLKLASRLGKSASVYSPRAFADLLAI
jgi:predicted nucleic acid-binding protein